MTLTCEVCARAVDGAFTCRDCLDQLHGDLVAIPDLARDLEVELTNQSRKGSGTRSSGSERPLPYSVQASALLAELRAELVTGCRLVALDDPTRLPADAIEAMAAWLDRHVHSVGQREGGGDICAGLARLRVRILRAIDSPPEKVYIGDCGGCGDRGTVTPMYAARSDPLYECRGCGGTHDVAEAMAALEAFLSDFRLTAAEVELATGKRVKAKRVHQWVSRGRIDRDTEGKVRFGDVISLEARAS